MASVYLTDLQGDGLDTSTAFRPLIPDGTPYVTMMTHSPSMSACVVSSVDNLSGPGIIRLVTGTTWSDLRAKGRSDTVPGNMRNVVNDWCTAQGFVPLPSGAISWMDAILFVCRQVNPAASLDLTYLGPPE